MRIHDLAPPAGSTKTPIRPGRGRAGRRGKTAGRGTKGAKARGQIPAGYEGGQMPLHMRLPKLPGFRNFNRVEFTVVNLDRLEQFSADSVIDAAALRAKGLVKKKGPIKILGTGEITKPLQVQANAFSSAAVTKIEAAGGSAQVIASPGSATPPAGG
ncbi:MAG: 50S ribosomal protein L15 [Actinomycetota bacterium]